MVLLPELSFNSPWYIYIAAPLFSLLPAIWLYFKNQRNKDLAATTIRLLFILRCLGFSLILFLLLNIFSKRVLNQTENPIILLAIDNSSSLVSGKDSFIVKKELLDKLELLKAKVGDKYEIKTLLFGESCRLSKEPPTFTDKETDIDNLIKEVDNNYSGQNVGALIILSDGIYNRGSNPLYAAEKLGFPLYTVALGDTSEHKDVFVQKIEHNQIAYLGNNFPVEVVVGSKKLSGREITVGLYQDGQLKSEQKIRVVSNNFSGTGTFTVPASAVGVVKYSIVIKPVEGEVNYNNNNQSFVIEVIDNRDKILLLANDPHPDISAIKEALASFGNYETEFAFYEGFSKPLKAYSLIVLHGHGHSQTSLLNECKSLSVPVWIINPQTTENLPGVKISAPVNRFNDSESYLNSTFGLFGLSDAFRKFAQELPAVKTFFGNYSVTNAANSLISQRIGNVETDNPILFFNELNGLKSGLFLGDGLWRWKLRDYAQNSNHNLFNELIGKSVQYLSVKSDKSFFRVLPPKIINENEAAEFGAEVYNQSYEPINEQEVTLDLSNKENKKFNFSFSKTGKTYRLNIGRLSPGEYFYKASVKKDGELLVKNGSFTVKEIQSEKIQNTANHQLLYQLSHRSNGRMYYLNELAQLQQDLLTNETIKPVTYSQNSVSPLVELKWLFWLILVFLSLEWLIRKRSLHI